MTFKDVMSKTGLSIEAHARYRRDKHSGYLRKLILETDRTPSHEGAAHNPLTLCYYLLPLLITWAHVLYSPYTKAEETPGLHAVHDILKYGVSLASLENYDHVLYPGAVPRSFVPSLLIASIVRPLLALASMAGLELSGLHIQMLVHLTLASIFSLSLANLLKTVHRVFSPLVALWTLLLTTTSFHIPYYAGRTLPNFFALPLVLFAYSYILRGYGDSGDRQPPTRYLEIGMALISVTATLVRLELAPMVASTALTLLCQRRLTWIQAVRAGGAGALSALLLSFTIDAYFLGRSHFHLRWFPELAAFMFNVVDGRASDWGTMGLLYYFKVLPRILLFASILLPYGIWVALHPNRFNEESQGLREMVEDVETPTIKSEFERTSLQVGFGGSKQSPEGNPAPESRHDSSFASSLDQFDRTTLLLAPCVAQVIALSCIGHKEWRFVIYVVPLLLIISAQGAASLWFVPHPWLKRIFRLGLACGLAINVCITAFMGYVSHLNYPGGQVGTILEELAVSRALDDQQTLRVWIPAVALHTGSTLFTLPDPSTTSISSVPLQIDHPESSYERSARPYGNSPSELWAEGYDLVVTDDWASFQMSNWTIVASIDGYRGIKLGKTSPWLWVDVGPRLAIVERAFHV